jgi:hypothetical protein
MALNITFDGLCSRDDGSLSNLDVQYQGFFYHFNTGSSPSTWNNVRTVENTGYWNINLGDGDWLTQDGSAAAGDRVVIVFWRTGSNRNADCPTMDEWGAFEITLDGSSTYTNPTQVKKNIAPDLHWIFPVQGAPHYVNTSYDANNTSEDVHSWNWSGTTMYHWYSKYSQTINYVNRINNSVYDWDDSTTTTGIQDYDGSHQWSSPGIYDVELVVEDECGLTATGTEQIQIYWHPPGCGITMYPSDPDPNDVIYFKYTGTDTDSTIDYIEWTINDGATTTTTSGASGDNIYHTEGLGTSWCGTSASGGAFTNSGSHLVEIILHWNDGFDDQTTDCDDTFTQGLFTGPTVSFSQDPFPAPVGSGIKFTNTSINTDRVGLGLSDCKEYTWTFTDGGVPTVYSDKPYSYELEVVPTSTDCQVELCAQWSDGFTTQETCESAGVPFLPYVTITPEDCYYNLNVVGTSNDGTVSGYSWTIASGTSETGPWTEIWTTPTGIEQNDKKVCFTSTGWYKATGYVYGGGTLSDDETIFITEVCPATISGAVDIIWNGTGILDTGGDWTHSGYGTETTASKHAGTNGLDMTGMTKSDITYFTASSNLDVSDYDMLTFWINIRDIQSNKNIQVSLYEAGGDWHSLYLSNYINLYDNHEVWRKVYIPLSDFGISSNIINELRFVPTGNIDIWLDDIHVSMGTIISVAVCEPSMYGTEWGKLDRTGKEIKPTMRANVDVVPSARVINTYPLPRNL